MNLRNFAAASGSLPVVAKLMSLWYWELYIKWFLCVNEILGISGHVVIEIQDTLTMA
ncbi:MAG: hypothetical protein ACLPSL_07765 [Smithella sp.]